MDLITARYCDKILSTTRISVERMKKPSLKDVIHVQRLHARIVRLHVFEGRAEYCDIISIDSVWIQ